MIDESEFTSENPYESPIATEIEGPPDEEPLRLGGWLLVFGFSEAFGPFANLLGSVMTLLDLRSPDSITLQNEYPGYFAATATAGVLGLLFAGFRFYVATQFFRRKTSAPNLLIATFVIGFILAMIDFVWLGLVFNDFLVEDFVEIFFFALIATICIAYLLLSRRVKRTFLVP